MSVTLEQVEARQNELAGLIAELKKNALAKVSLPAVAFDLRVGERYAGTVLDESGAVKYHLVLLPARPDGTVNWEKAKKWAKTAGGELPNRQEQALLYANCKAHLPKQWCWSSEAEGSSYAWGCNFDNGYQGYGYQSYEGGAVAVRRVNP